MIHTAICGFDRSVGLGASHYSVRLGGPLHPVAHSYAESFSIFNIVQYSIYDVHSENFIRFAGVLTDQVTIDEFAAPRCTDEQQALISFDMHDKEIVLDFSKPAWAGPFWLRLFLSTVTRNYGDV
jgi:hypothetical protein